MDCFNLRRMFGDRYKVGYEESYYAEYGPNAVREDPWLMIILCQHGHICPWGESNLAACTDKNGLIANRLRKLPFIDRNATMDGDDGINAVFDIKHFATVAQIMKPRKRRRMTEEQRAAASERLRKYQPAKGQTVQDVVRQAPETAQICEVGPQGDAEASKPTTSPF